MSLTLVEAANDFIEYKVYRRGATSSTEVTYRSAMKCFIQSVPITTVEQLTIDVIDSHIMCIGKSGFKPKTFKNKITIIRSFVRYLYAKNLTNIRPESIDIPKVKDDEANFLNAEEQQTLLRACLTARERAVIQTLMSSGLRVSELAELRCSDIFERSLIVKNGKGGKARVTFITEDCEKTIAEYIATKPRRCTYLFTNQRCEPMSRQFIHRIVKEVAARSGIEKKVSPHTLRHTFATNLLWRGARLEDVKPLMGHANMATTMIYMHFTNDYLHGRYDEAMAKKQQM